MELSVKCIITIWFHLCSCVKLICTIHVWNVYSVIILCFCFPHVMVSTFISQTELSFLLSADKLLSAEWRQITNCLMLCDVFLPSTIRKSCETFLSVMHRIYSQYRLIQPLVIWLTCLINQRLLVSANTRLHICHVTTSCRHYDDNCNLMLFTMHKLSISKNWPCRPHRCPADTSYSRVHGWGQILSCAKLSFEATILVGNNRRFINTIQVASDIKCWFHKTPCRICMLQLITNFKCYQLPQIYYERQWTYHHVASDEKY